MNAKRSLSPTPATLMLTGTLCACGETDESTDLPPSDAPSTLATTETEAATKIAKDPESAEMFNIIIDNIYIDAGIIYTKALETFHNTFREIIGSGRNTVTSDYKRVTAKAEKALRTMVGRPGRVIDGKIK